MSYEEKYRHLFEVVCKHLNLDGIFFVEIDSVTLSALDCPVNVVLLLTVYLAPALPTLVEPLYQPSAT